jgi:hypothetical protein
MAQHGDLQLTIIYAQSDEQAEEAAHDAIQEEREHGPSLIDSQASPRRRNAARQRRCRICLPHTRSPQRLPWLRELDHSDAQPEPLSSRPPRTSVGTAPEVGP